MAKLVAQSGPTAGREYPITKDLTVLGRQSSNDVQIIDNMASRAHCQVRRDDGRFYTLVDLGSRNGTQVNGKKVSERMLFYGDRIRVGEVEFMLTRESGDVELKDLLTKYDLHEKIGEGGMGLVFKATQRSMAREVAIKILAPKYAQKPKWVEQFTNEARAAGKLNHQNIIQVHDVGTENGVHFFSMEFVDGPTCMGMLKQHGALDAEPALEITRQVARALDYAHSQRLIHQDIKPDNIMVGSNEVVKLADLGISKTFDEIANETGPKKIMGTPHYMAPEAALGKKIDHRVDLYSLGATLYHLLAGKTPFHGATPTDVLKAHVMEPLPSIGQLNPRLSPEVVALVEKLLAKEPDQRYQHAHEVEVEIDRILSGKGFSKDRSETVVLRRYAEGVKPGSPGPADLTPEESGQVEMPRSKQPRGLLVAALAVLAIAAAGIIFLRGGSRAVETGSPTVTPPPVAQQQVSTQTANEPPPNTAPAIDRTKVAGQLAALEQELAKPSDQVKIGELRRLLGDIPVEGLPGDLAARRIASAERIEAFVRRRQLEQVQDSFAALQNEVGKLVDEHNYDLATQRLNAFKGRNDPTIKDRFADALDSVRKSKQGYIAWIEEQVKLGQARKDLPGLKSLRDGLPQAWLGTPQEQQIVAAMKGIENDQAAALDKVVDEAGKRLAKWDFSGYVDYVRSQRRLIKGSSAEPRITAMNAAATKLAELPAAIDQRLQANGKLRFRGALRRISEPDVLRAYPDKGLELQPATGGTMLVQWPELSAQELGAVTALVFKATAGDWQAAIDTLGTVQPAAAGAAK